MELPVDLTYGRVAQSQVNVAGQVRPRWPSWPTTSRPSTGPRCAVARDARRRRRSTRTGPSRPGRPPCQAARQLGLPSVITMHGGDVYVNPEQGYDFPTRWYVRPPLRWTLRHAGALTAITDDCRQHALRAGRAGRVRSTSSSTAPTSAASVPAPGGQAACDPRYGPHMIFACRQLFPRKGIRFLIEAAAQLKPRFPDLQVVVAGDGFERPELIKLAETPRHRRSDVTFLGWVPNTELPPYYRAAAMSVIPSLEEGFGIPAAEAMGCETPVVASDAGGLPEVVEHGVTGLIVPRGDSAALAEAIGVPAGRSRAARAAWDAPGGSARCACSTGIAPPSSSSRSTRASARGRAGDRSAVRVSLGRGSSGLHHRRACPGSGPSAGISAFPTPSSSTWAAPPTCANGWARGSALARPSWPTGTRST